MTAQPLTAPQSVLRRPRPPFTALRSDFLRRTVVATLITACVVGLLGALWLGPLWGGQYFLAALRPSLEHPHVRSLLELLRSEAWKAQLDALPGYAADRSGEVLSLRRVLPWWGYRTPKG